MVAKDEVNDHDHFITPVRERGVELGILPAIYPLAEGTILTD